jgi:hypothetical protein
MLQDVKKITFTILMGAGKLVFGWMKKQNARMSTLSKLGNLIGFSLPII